MKRLAGVGLLALLMSLSASAQVEKVVADAEGITWAACAAVMEIALRRLDGVDKVAISMERQQIAVTYKGNSGFEPQQLREAVGRASVTITKFRIQAQGRLRIRGDRQYLDAGRDRFLLIDPPTMPDDKMLLVGGEVLDDQADPMELKVIDFRAIDPE